MTSTLDLAGATSALLCAVHCIATGMFVAVLPVLGSGALMDEAIEQAFLTAAVVLGLLSIGLGLRAHGQRTPGLFLVAGLVLLLAARPRIEEGTLAEVLIVIAGALLLVLAHWRNLRAGRFAVAGLEADRFVDSTAGHWSSDTTGTRRRRDV